MIKRTGEIVGTDEYVLLRYLSTDIGNRLGRMPIEGKDYLVARFIDDTDDYCTHSDTCLARWCTVHHVKAGTPVCLLLNINIAIAASRNNRWCWPREVWTTGIWQREFAEKNVLIYYGYKIYAILMMEKFGPTRTGILYDIDQEALKYMKIDLHRVVDPDSLILGRF